MNTRKSRFSLSTAFRAGPTAFMAAALVAAVAIFVTAVAPCTARAGTIVTTPANLQPGDQFRVVFLTDANLTHSSAPGSAPTSTDINYYNTFVQNDALTENGGSPTTYNGTTLHFAALASTDSVSAMSNVGVYGVPVYTPAGGYVAPSDDGNVPVGTFTGSIYSGINSGYNVAPFQDLQGIYLNPGFDLAFTGTNRSGGIATGNALGDAAPIVGLPDEYYSPNIAIDWETFPPDTRPQNVDAYSYGLYGISQPLTVPAVPEPGTLALLGVALLGLGFAYRHRRAANA